MFKEKLKEKNYYLYKKLLIIGFFLGIFIGGILNLNLIFSGKFDLHFFYNIFIAIIISEFITFLISFFEISLSKILKLYSLPGIIHFLIRLIYYFIIIVSLNILIPSLFFQKLIFPSIQVIIFSLFISFSFIFFFFLFSFLDPKALISFFTMKYRNPKIKEVIVMYIDLRNSTKLASHLNSKLFFKILNEFIHIIQKAVFVNGGSTYKLLGDGIIALWEFSNKNILKSFETVFDIESGLDEFAEELLKIKDFEQFSLNFAASLHIGKVLIGQIGAFRSEIAYIGDPLNVGERILSFAKSKNSHLAISEAFILQFSNSGFLEKFTEGYRFKNNKYSKYIFKLHQQIKLKGKDIPLNVYTLNEA